MANQITVLMNNIIIIGNTTEVEGGLTILKPFSIQGGNGQDFMLTPLFEAHIGQNIPEMFVRDSSILTSVEAENNDLLQGYLQKISGIEIPKQEIILG